MSEGVKAGLIIGAAIVIATAVWIYFSPYQSCLRHLGEKTQAVVFCVKNSN